MKLSKSIILKLFLLLALFSSVLFFIFQNQIKDFFSLKTYSNEYFTIKYPSSAEVVDVLEAAQENDSSWLEETILYIRIDKSNFVHDAAYGVIKVTTLDTQGAVNNVKYLQSEVLGANNTLLQERQTTFNGYDGVELIYQIPSGAKNETQFYKYVILSQGEYSYILGFDTDKASIQTPAVFTSFTIMEQ